MDRRKRRTRNAIQKACVELIREKGFDSMSILDIAERADINRATFYLHFLDKFDMIDQFEHEIMQEIEENLTDQLSSPTSMEATIRSRYEPLVKVFTVFQEKRDILEILFQTKGVMAIQNRFHMIALKMVDAKMKETPTNSFIKTPELFINVFASIMIGIASSWINESEKMTPEDLASDLMNILINGPARTAGLLPGDLINVTDILHKKN